MCGIFGYIGNKENASNLVFEGLKTLEYRGYDSWGVAVKINNKIKIEKEIGKIGDKKISLPASQIGIGHTRWATHGGVSIKNAHPHLDCTKEIAVLHNGIIENYQELKKELLKKGHAFISETDTEVVPHLIEDFLKHNDLETAVKNTFNLLKGLNAIVVLDSRFNKIIACKNGSPLIVGVGDKEYFISSDAVGILPYTRKVIFLKDNELISLGVDLKLFKLPLGEIEKPKIETINWEIESANKGKYKHFMIKEIYEQPKIIRNLAESYKDQIIKLKDIIQKSRGTFFIGSGTAYFASLSGVYLFSKIAKKHANTAPASEFNYLEDFLNKESLVIAFSQSGETIDVIEPLNRAKEKGSTIVSMVNVLGSSIYRMSDYKMLLGAEPERAVASTKAFISKITLLIMLSYSLIDQVDSASSLLLKAANEVERLLDYKNVRKIKSLAKKIYNKEHLYVIGRGISYASALEAAMKIKEVSYIHAEGLAGGELKHGPIALIDKGTPCIVFAPKDETYDAIISNATEIKARGGFIIGIAEEKLPIFDYFIKVSDIENCSVISQIIPIQLLAYFLALEKKLDPDKPRNLAKSVTVK